MPLFSDVFSRPYVDVLRLFAAEDWAHAEMRGDVEQTIDKSIGKRVFVMRGKTAAANYLALPRAGAPALGLDGAHLYIELRLTGQPYVLHIDVMNHARWQAAYIHMPLLGCHQEPPFCAMQVRGPTVLQQPLHSCQAGGHRAPGV